MLTLVYVIQFVCPIRWGKKVKKGKGVKKGKKGKKFLKDKGHKNTGFKTVYHKEEWGKSSKVSESLWNV